jgi:uncharacterized protein
MAISFYEISVPVYQQFLRALLGVLDKSEKHCAEKGIDPATLFATRLFEDMQPFAFQIMQSINHSAGALALIRGQQRARASGLETFASAKRAIEEALTELEAIKPPDLDAAATKPVELKLPGRELKFTGLGYLLSFALPQFFFHVTTAYDILRHKGVPIGKRDFMGQVQVKTS